jgi:hypothetical protein
VARARAVRAELAQESMTTVEMMSKKCQEALAAKNR